MALDAQINIIPDIEDQNISVTSLYALMNVVLAFVNLIDLSLFFFINSTP